jgi:hypothetical protein
VIFSSYTTGARNTNIKKHPFLLVVAAIDAAVAISAREIAVCARLRVLGPRGWFVVTHLYFDRLV